MRKIEQEMISAIKSLRGNGANAAWQKDNTRVTNHRMPGAGNATEIMLHGNHIATISDNDGVSITLAGWNTPTTRSRLTAICRAFVPGCFGVSTKQGQASIRYADGRDVRIMDSGWYLAS